MRPISCRSSSPAGWRSAWHWPGRLRSGRGSYCWTSRSARSTPLTRMAMQDHLLELWHHYGPTVVFVSHDMEEGPGAGRPDHRARRHARPRGRRVRPRHAASAPPLRPAIPALRDRLTNVMAPRGQAPQSERSAMQADDLRALQAPLKDRYRAEPGAALVTAACRGLARRRRGSHVRSRRARRWSKPGCIRRRAATGLPPAPATCCWKHWSPAPA